MRTFLALSACVVLSSVASARAASPTVAVTLRDTTVAVGASTVSVGAVVFTVTNRAKVARSFAVAGHSTPKLAPGTTVTLKVGFASPGAQAYVSAGGNGPIKGALQVIQPCTSPTASTVNVSLGQDQGGLTLSPTSVPCGPVTFVITDTGMYADDVLVFADLPSEKGASPELNPGQGTKLTINFTTKGAATVESGEFPPAEPEMGGDFFEQARLTLT